MGEPNAHAQPPAQAPVEHEQTAPGEPIVDEVIEPTHDGEAPTADEQPEPSEDGDGTDGTEVPQIIVPESATIVHPGVQMVPTIEMIGPGGKVIINHTPRDIAEWTRRGYKRA